MQISDSYPTALTDFMTLYINFFSSATTSDNLTHYIKIIWVRFGFAPAPYWFSVPVVYRHDTEKTQEWFSSEDMSPFSKDLGLQVCVAQCHSVTPDLAKRLLQQWKSCPFSSFESFKPPRRLNCCHHIDTKWFVQMCHVTGSFYLFWCVYCYYFKVMDFLSINCGFQ